MSDQRPHILCILTDQHRADHLGCYGNPDVRTPHIDRLAREGALFTESYVANPVCMPNRASMFTGRYPKAHGLRENGNALSLDEVVLPGVLRRAGYQTASIGKIHLAPFGLSPNKATHAYELCESKEIWETDYELPLPYYGLERVYLADGHGSYAFGHYKRDLEKEHPGASAKLRMENALVPPTGARESWKASIPEELHYNTVIADKTIEYLRDRDPSKPFFLWCSFPDPHHPYSPPAPWCHEYDPAEIAFAPRRRDGEMDDLPAYFRECREGRRSTGGLVGDVRKTTDDHYREIHAHTYGMISMVDHNVGRIVRALEDTGLIDNTIIVFFSDHGDLMGDHWLINKGPFLFRGLVRIPTIWRLPRSLRKNDGAPSDVGKSSDAFVSTVDLCPTLLDLAGVAIPEGVQGRSYARVLTGDADKIQDSAYIEYDETYLPDRLRQFRTKEWALTYCAENEYGLLFDLRNDPDELRNLWDRPERQGAKKDLLAELLRRTSVADDWLPAKKCHA
jgi:arylsulfatase A-like enzyme